MKHDGIYLLRKPASVSSQKALANFKLSLGFTKHLRKNIGHCGTLDPFATGLLLVGIEEGTKLLAPLTGLDKTYEVKMILGATTETFDSEAEFLFPKDRLNYDKLSNEFFINFLQEKIGKHQQIPPKYSAVKIDGQRAYKLARKNIDFNIKSKNIIIHSAFHKSYENQKLNNIPIVVWNFSIKVSTGTYIRSLARDWGKEIVNFKGMLLSLNRVSIGDFELSAIPKEKKHLKLFNKSLLKVFDSVKITTLEQEKLLNNGIWSKQWCNEQSLNKHTLVLNKDSKILAYMINVESKCGRVLNHPI